MVVGSDRMNNIVETYLTFKADNIVKYIKVLSEEKRVSSKIPRQLNRLIYKYYNLFVLSNKEVDYEFLKQKTSLEEPQNKLILFYLLIEFDMTSKKELSDKSLYDFYNFIVNSIIIFIELEQTNSKEKTHYSYEESMKSILKKYNDSLEVDYLLLLDSMYLKLSKVYNESVKKTLRFKELLNSENYLISYSKVKNTNNLYFNKFKYKNDLLDNESKKDVEIISQEYRVEHDFINVELTSYNILKNAFINNKRIIFINLSDNLLSKKINITKLVNYLSLNCLIEQIYFIINNSNLEKYESNITYLLDRNINICFYKDTSLIKNDLYKKTKYLLVDYDEDYNNYIKFANNYDLELITNFKYKIVPDKLSNIKYINV